MTDPAHDPLPIDPVLPELARALGDGRNAVLQAPPGAGKTTRVPLALLDAPWLRGRGMLMLEPRRLAARAAAHYMARTLGEEVGGAVGYRVRLDSRIGPGTRIQVVTEGVLTRMLQTDAALEGFGLVIFDEFHERSLQADLGLALCLQAQAVLREDLRLLVMSATLDGAAVAGLLDDAPMVTSAGRSHPVEIRHLPPAPSRQRGGERFNAAHVAAAVRQALAADGGSALVFLPGVAEIKQVERALRDPDLGRDLDLAPLYGSLPQPEQDLAIRPSPAGRRKVVLATGIAETSLTIDGIRIVIDAGLMRVPRFEPRSGMTRLQTLRVSQASATQRCGRAGRLEPGVCYRLWGAEEQQALVPYTSAEILDADLAPLALELARWGADDPAQLRWLDPPPAAAYAQARDLLARLGALDAGGGLTAHGRGMAELGMHPRLAHMVLKGRALGLGAPACELAALLSERDILRSGDRDADLRLRLELLHSADARGPASRQVDRGACRRIVRAAQQWRRHLRIPARQGDAGPDRAGLLLALAYPDRIAQRRPGADNRFRLANGRGAHFAQPEPLAAQEYLVAAHLGGGEREARIFLAAAITRAELLEHFAGQIEELRFVAWDSREQAVLARRRRRLGELVLADEPLAEPDPAQVSRALLDGIRQLGPDCLPWTKPLRAWQARVQFLHRLQSGDWPDVSDAALLDTAQDWLAAALAGRSRRTHLQDVDLKGALAGLLDWRRQRALDELAPTHVTVPSGSRISIDYAGGETPVLAVRLQELFGTTDTPRIAAGEVPLLLHLLSPAGRPVQVTRDLAGFWANTYHDVKKDLKGRYPKHHWPDDPLRAQPTSRVRRK